MIFTLQPTYSKTEDNSVTVNQSHSGSGHNIVAKTVNIGEPPLEVSDQMMANFAETATKLKPLKLMVVEPQRSMPAAHRFIEFLRNRGVIVDELNTSEMVVPKMSQPIELRGNQLFLKADK